MITTKVHLRDRSYDIVIGDGLLKKVGGILKKLDIGQDAVVITNERLLRLYRRPLEKSLTEGNFTVHFETVPDSEKAKSAAIATRLIDRISKRDKRKSIFIIAFGGGVVGDLAGFVAAVYKRGIPYIQIPTTLLAQVDSAIGGKVAIDLSVAKNMVGAFYQPKTVISDVSVLKSLSTAQLRNGLAEIIKYGIIEDAGLFSFLEANYTKILKRDRNTLEHIIKRSARIKANFVERDELDKKGVRAMLNYGHTIGHAIEAACGYSSRYNHGEAIAIGMIVAARISQQLGLMHKGPADRIERLIKSAGLPTKIEGLRFEDIYESHLHDKKFSRNKNMFVLPTRIGKARVVEGVSDSVIRSVLKVYLKKRG